ncbi:Transcriptional regulator, LysR family [Granulibacter bethesdensis]|uniref:Transcriptional regulator, LysR family n=2 Tax=Granulibacter bethesdensis TaxID=364410 RepID=A0AAC9K9M5_9PROT|nr:Transcriptional regulator, LysR family [Granulibacter bethesdensis]APH61774.1 Transcriptional regulator, LysR family [Granulibacter bethesdensis]
MICFRYRSGMDLRHFRYFLAVAEELNFRRAAERLNMAQPPLSSQIHDLEREIGVSLFRRVPKGAELTEAGVAFLAEVPAVFEQVERAVGMAQRGGRGEVGRLRVGYTGSTTFNEIVPESLRKFRRAFPDVELALDELNSVVLIDRLLHQRLDAAFIRPGKEPPANVNVLPLPSESMMVAVSSEHRLAGRYAVELSELEGEPMVLFSRALGSAFYDEIIQSCREAGFEPRIEQVAPQILSIANLVAAEIGVSIVPERVAAAAVAGVSYLPIKGIAPVARIALATRIDDRSVITKNFRTLVQQTVRRA